jgi:hypothetical protein
VSYTNQDPGDCNCPCACNECYIPRTGLTLSCAAGEFPCAFEKLGDECEWGLAVSTCPDGYSDCGISMRCPNQLNGIPSGEAFVEGGLSLCFYALTSFTCSPFSATFSVYDGSCTTDPYNPSDFFGASFTVTE